MGKALGNKDIYNSVNDTNVEKCLVKVKKRHNYPDFRGESRQRKIQNFPRFHSEAIAELNQTSDSLASTPQS